nr:unnamed protein product [Spodoptera littoralis]
MHGNCKGFVFIFNVCNNLFLIDIIRNNLCLDLFF